jgi:L-asparaginase
MGEGIGLAIKVEDGSNRAKWAVALQLLKQLEWLTPSALEELEQKFLFPIAGQRLDVRGELH